MQKSQLNTAIFYTCGVCNLQCKYCGIDKNPILNKIDEALGESFKGDYYFNQVKKYFPNKGSLKRIETWGGEPFLKMDRIYPLVHQLINYYPYLTQFYSSTNFSYPTWIDQFFGLMDQFRQYPDRDFEYILQLSIDGPEYINDINRGNGVTQRCLENYHNLIQEIAKGRLPDNVELRMTLKATLDNNSIRALNDKNKIIEYFQFFENEFWEPCNNLNKSNVKLMLAAPNTAVPSPVTVEEGKIFAELCKKCREVETENLYKKYFKVYDKIVLFYNDNAENKLTYRYSHHTCGSGTTMIGFMPDNMLSICHEGFTHFIEEYKKTAAISDRVNTSTITFDKFLSEQSVPYCVDEKGYEEHCRKMRMFDNVDTTARLMNIAVQIVTLAMAKQIDECYLDHTNALKAAIFIQSHTAFCLKDNYNKTGSFTMIPNGTLKLLLNGAMQYIQGEDELKVERGTGCNGLYCDRCNNCR